MELKNLESEIQELQSVITKHKTSEETFTILAAASFIGSSAVGFFSSESGFVNSIVGTFWGVIFGIFLAIFFGVFVSRTVSKSNKIQSQMDEKLGDLQRKVIRDITLKHLPVLARKRKQPLRISVIPNSDSGVIRTPFSRSFS